MSDLAKRLEAAALELRRPQHKDDEFIHYRSVLIKDTIALLREAANALATIERETILRCAQVATAYANVATDYTEQKACANIAADILALSPPAASASATGKWTVPHDYVPGKYPRMRGNAGGGEAATATEHNQIVSSPITLHMEPREDEGLRIRCDELPGLIMSHRDHAALFRDLPLVIRDLFEHGGYRPNNTTEQASWTDA